MSSGEDPRSKSLRPSEAVENEAAAWVARQQAGLAAGEEDELATWRGQDLRHEEAFQRFHALAAALNRARQSGAMRGIRGELAVRSRRRRSRRLALAATAVAAAVAFGLNQHLWRAGPPPAVPATVRCVAVVRHLPDGSTVELNGDSQLAVRYDAAFRRVELLHGEALFHVAKDARHPFIVRAGNVDVRAVGTAFSVRLAPKEVDVLVTEGKVGVDDAGAGRSLLPGESAPDARPLLAGQRAVVATVRPALAVVTSVSPAEIAQRLAWRTPRIQFDGLELAIAVRQMNDRNRVQIALGNGAIGHLHISGSFSADDPRTFARLAAETFGLSWEEQNGTIVLRQP